MVCVYLLLKNYQKDTYYIILTTTINIPIKYLLQFILQVPNHLRQRDTILKHSFIADENKTKEQLMKTFAQDSCFSCMTRN